MDKAKAAVSHFVSKSGKHDTDVHERVAPGVTQETVKPTRHEEFQEAVDKEIHQDHYHTTVQPVQDREIRPEEHRHQMSPTQHKEFSHGNDQDTRRKLEETASQFKNTSTTHETKHTASAAPTVEGERVHHHVHETVQPVLHKETITPEVVHTTVPIHETHHAGAEHHGTSVLPVKHLSDFTSGGGNLTGGQESKGYYEGCPRPFNESMQIGSTSADRDHHINSSGLGHSGTGTHTTTSTNTTTSGPHTSSIANKADPRVDSDRDGSRGLGNTGGHTGQLGTTGASNTDPNYRNGPAGYGSGHDSHATSGQHKPSMMDKLNPMKDSDGDGKKGFMK